MVAEYHTISRTPRSTSWSTTAWVARLALAPSGFPNRSTSLADSESVSRQDELVKTLSVVAEWPAGQRRRLVSRLIELRACDPLHDALASVVVHVPSQWTRLERQRWEVAADTEKSGSTGAIFYELRTAPWPKKGRILWDGIWLGNEELIATDVQHRSSRAHLLVSRLGRWRRGLKSLPGAILSVGRANRRVTKSSGR